MNQQGFSDRAGIGKGYTIPIHSMAYFYSASRITQVTYLTKGDRCKRS